MALKSLLNQSKIPVDDFIQGLPQGTRFYAVLMGVTFACSDTQGEDFRLYAGSDYEKVVNATQGQVYSFCSTDLEKSFYDLGTKIGQAGSQLSQLFDLAAKPDQTTIEVQYQGKSLPMSDATHVGVWHYEAGLNVVVIESTLFVKGSDYAVKVSYKPL